MNIVMNSRRHVQVDKGMESDRKCHFRQGDLEGPL